MEKHLIFVQENGVQGLQSRGLLTMRPSHTSSVKMNDDQVIKDDRTIKNDFEIQECIYRYAYIEDYISSKNGKTYSYAVGKRAVIAYLIDLKASDKKWLSEKLGLCEKTVENWKLGVQTPDIFTAVHLCLLFRLTYLNSILFLQVLGHNLHIAFIYDGNQIKRDQDWWFHYVLSNYLNIDSEALKKNLPTEQLKALCDF